MITLETSIAMFDTDPSFREERIGLFFVAQSARLWGSPSFCVCV